MPEASKLRYLLIRLFAVTFLLIFFASGCRSKEEKIREHMEIKSLLDSQDPYEICQGLEKVMEMKSPEWIDSIKFLLLNDEVCGSWHVGHSPEDYKSWDWSVADITINALKTIDPDHKLDFEKRFPPQYSNIEIAKARRLYGVEKLDLTDTASSSDKTEP
jgi:hypothetical protein